MSDSYQPQLDRGGGGGDGTASDLFLAEALVSSLCLTHRSAQELSVGCERGELEGGQLGPRVRVTSGSLCE